MTETGAENVDSPNSTSTLSTRAGSNFVLSLSRFLLMGMYTAYCYAAYLVLRVLADGPLRKADVALEREHRWLKGCTRIVGFQVKCHGTLPKDGSLIAPNHLGYADIMVIGGLCRCFFVAKADVESWPIIGVLYKTTEQISVPRGRKQGVLEANRRIAERLERGQSVCVFLEGTSSGGHGVLPFHASLLQPAIDAQVSVVPVSIRWSSDQVGVQVADDIAYWKDHVLLRHLFRLMGLRGSRVTISFGEPVDAKGADRKELADSLRAQVVAMLEISSE